MDMANYCRTCLGVPKNPKNLFQAENNLIKKIYFIATIKVEGETTRDLPPQICERCFENINFFYNFKKIIIRSDMKLRGKLRMQKLSKSTVKSQNRRVETIKKNNILSGKKSQENLQKKEGIIHENSQIKTDDNSSKSQNTEKTTTEDLLISSTAAQKDQQNETKILNSDPDDNVDKNLRKNIISSIKAQCEAFKRIYQCCRCQKKFDSKVMLENHKRTEHVDHSVCNICGTKTRAENMRVHLKTHAEDPIKCDDCGKLLKYSSLRTHKLLHTSISYTCEICDRKLKIKSHYNRHLKKHKDPEYGKVSCNLCGKKVHRLKPHMQSHTGEKPHICQNCGNGFSSTYALKTHSRLHTNETPYKCDFCDSSFPQKVSLVTHLKSKHNISKA